ncbi:MAG: 30S ribosomal protein S12 methylthiotransferase RimO [Candidatus Aminicenantaceae bacterium]
MKTLALISYGCAKNLVDSEIMLGYLNKAGYTFVSNSEKADTVIINTCGFIQPAKEETLEALQKAVDQKSRGKVKQIIAAGCFVERYKDNLIKKFPQIDIWLGVNDFDKIVQAVESKPFKKSKKCFLYNHTSPRYFSTPPVWTYIKISEGCSHECSFCSIPLIKGSYRSRTIPSIIREAEHIAALGVKEINIVSQDTTYFGRDIGLNKGLTLLLKELLMIKGIEWIRILYGYPEEISESLLEIMREKKICPYLDIPLQHSETKIIKKMKRAMNGERALKLIRKIRKKVPSIALRTSLVVGFPGEGKEEFDNLKRFCKKARFDHLGVFTYSQEEGTSSFSLGDPVEESEKTRRKEELMQIQADISLKNNHKYLNKKIEVLIEGTLKEDPELLVGRTQFQAPEIDGVVFIPHKGKISKVVNTIQNVEIIDYDTYDLYGKLIR